MFVENTAPTVNQTSGFQPALTPLSPSVTSNITAVFNVSDAEGDSTTKHYLWYKNGMLNTSWNDSNYVNYTGGNFSTLDSIYVVVYANDGYEDSSQVQSNTVIIGSENSAPSLSGISLNPSNQKYNKQIWVNSSTPITDTESSTVQLKVYYKLGNGTKVYLSNSTWSAPPYNASVQITIPWGDGALHTIFAQAEDSGNATGYNNLTSSEVSATFSSNITTPTLTESVVSATEINTGEVVNITATFNGQGANITSARVYVERPDATASNWTMTCGTTSVEVECYKQYTTTSDVGYYFITWFYPLEDSQNEGKISSSLSFRAIQTQGVTGGGGGGGHSLQPEETQVPMEITFRDITEGATEPQAADIAGCLTDSLLMSYKCSDYNYGVVVEPFNWWVAVGAFIGAGVFVFSKNIIKQTYHNIDMRNILLYSLSTVIFIAISVEVGFNAFFLNYIIDSSKYVWTFTSFVLWGVLGAIIGEELKPPRKYKLKSRFEKWRMQ